jgi:hypothetical protein
MGHGVVIVERPCLTVTRRGPAGAGGTSYDAQALSLALVDGRWCLTFLCSGSLVSIPAAEVAGIAFSERGAQWCVSCDGRLTSWPINDPSYAREIPADNDPVPKGGID